MNVLLGIDGSDRTFDALKRTVQRVHETGDELTIAVVESEIDDGETIHSRIHDVLDEENVDATVHHIEGHAGGELVEMADSEEFERLVVSGGEHTPTGKIRFTPTTEFVLLNAETSVTLAR